MRRGIWLVFFVGVLVGSVNTVWPQSAAVQMEEVVVTATRTLEEARNVPNSVVVLGRAEIEASSARNAGELLKGALGVEINGYGPLGSAQSVSIRGSSASQVLVMVDGRPINSITYGSADLSEVPIEMVERIEIVKGPTSHLYGANAMGGVVNIITRKSTAPFSLKAGASYGSYNTQIYAAELGQTAGRFSYLLNGGYKVSDGYRDNSDYEGKDLSAKLTYQPLERLSLSLLSVFHQDGLGVPGPKPAAGTVPRFGNSEVTSLFDHQDSTLFNNNLGLTWDLDERLQVKGQVYQDWRELRYRQKYDLFGAAYEDISQYKAGIWGGNVLARWRLPRENTLTFGVDYRQENLDARTETTDLGGLTTTVNQWKPDNSLWGFFAQDHWQALSWLRLVGGIRYDQTSSYGSETSPDLGLILSPQKATRFKLHYGESFRPPTFNDLYWPNFGNTQLKPEKGVSYEVGWEQDLLDQKAALTLNLFRWQVTDKIEWVPDATGTWKPQNVNEQNTWGGEFGFRWSLSKALSLSLGYTYLEARQKNEEVQNALTNETALVERRAASVPRHQGTLTLAYRMPWGTQAFLTGRYVGDRVFYYSDYSQFPAVSQQEKTLGAYYTLDLKFSQVFAKHWQATLSLLNLTNQSYDAQPGTSFDDRNYPAPGFSASLGLTYTF